MGKRLHRIPHSQLEGMKNQLLDIELHLVLTNGNTFHGIIRQWKDDACEFVDYRNHKQRIPLHLIEEIITDKITTY